MQVIISVGGRFHADHAARAAQEAGCLKRLITTTPNSRWMEIDQDLVKYIPLPEYVGLGNKSTPLLRDLVNWSWVRDNLFDLMASRYVDKCDIFHGWNAYSLFSLKKPKAQGAIIVIERSSPHPDFEYRILLEEYRKYNVMARPRESRSLMEKQKREYELADFVIVPSKLVWDTMVQEGVEEGKLILIPFGVDIDMFSPPSQKGRLL